VYWPLHVSSDPCGCAAGFEIGDRSLLRPGHAWKCCATRNSLDARDHDHGTAQLAASNLLLVNLKRIAILHVQLSSC
jgi:hypothetical protein